MKARIAVGDVEIRLEGTELTLRQLRGLIELAAAAAQAIAPTTPTEPETTTEAGHAIGFSATIERLPEEIPKEDLDWYFDE